MLYDSFTGRTIRKCRKISVLICTVLLLICLTGCSALSFSPISQRKDPPSGYIVEVYPNEEDLSGTQSIHQANVYYRISNENLLAPVLMRFELGIGQTIEAAVIQALIEGPGVIHELSGLIPEGTQLVSVKEQHGYLEVTLSKEFLEVSDDIPAGWEKNPQWVEEVARRRLLATYSIINSITDLGRYNAVLILIDVNDDGNGQRVERSNFGLSSSSGEPIEPLPRDTALIQTPQSVVTSVITAINNKQSSTLARFVDFGELHTTSQLISDSLLSYTFSAGQISGETIVRQDGMQAVVTVDCEFSKAGELTQTVFDAPLCVVRDEYIWKVDYTSLSALLSGE